VIVASIATAVTCTETYAFNKPGLGIAIFDCVGKWRRTSAYG